MSAVAVITLLFVGGVLVLIAELFLPSHGLLTVVALGLIVAGVVQTFRYGGERAGAIAGAACLIGLPTFAMMAVRIWPKTWIGRRIAPPNPTVTESDSSVPVEELSRHVGQRGRSLTPLRPVGICEFNGRRVSCIAQFGMIDAGETVEGLHVTGSNLAVESKVS